MKYLDYSKLAAFRAQYYPDENATDYVDVRYFFGPDALNPATISIRYNHDPFVLSDPVIDSFAREVSDQMRSEGRLHDGPPVMKLVTYDFDSQSPHLGVQPTDYALQAGTCFALDFPHRFFHNYGGTLRDYYRQDCTTPTVDNNPLAICLGVCGCLIVEDNGQKYLLAVKRSGHLASLENTIGPSVAGVVDYSSVHTNLVELNESALGLEIEEELNLKREEFAIVPLAWAIELFRGERPQLFSLIRTNLNRRSIQIRLESIPQNRREFESFEFVPLDDSYVLDFSHLKAFNYEARMNVMLMRKYLTVS